VPAKVIDERAVVGEVQWRAECDKDCVYQTLCPMPLAIEYSVQSDCQHNQYLACTNRVACKWPTCNVKKCAPVVDAISRYLGQCSKIPFAEWGSKYTGMKRVRYLRAVESLDSRPIGRKDSFIQAFVKLEKLADPNKDPRMIQARGARFNVSLGDYLKAFEHKLYHMKGEGHMAKWLPPGRAIVKGMNPVARAHLLSSHWTSLRKPVQLALDCSRFDGHVGLQTLQMEHSIYKRCFPGDKTLQRLLDWQCKNVCYTRSGLRYVVEGRRMSGDMNTALGNCVVMVVFIATAMRRLGIPRSSWRIADDGDDCCLMVEEEFAHICTDGLPKIFNEFGQELKIESIARSISQVTLCGSRMVRVGGVRTMILAPGRTIGKTRISVKVQSPKFRPDYVATVGACLLALHSGVPVLQAHALALKRASNKTLKDLPGSYLYRLAYLDDPLSIAPQPVTLQARLDFADAFDISISAQLELEEWFNRVNSEQLLGLAPPMEVPGDNYYG
jgi:hypothetical protein